jgi:pfkB family carbohydrate kinase
MKMLSARCLPVVSTALFLLSNNTPLVRSFQTLNLSLPRKYPATTITTTTLKMSYNNNKIVVVGSANQDLTSNSDVLPSLGETVMGKDFATACGGKGANQAVAAGMLGLAPGEFYCIWC